MGTQFKREEIEGLLFNAAAYQENTKLIDELSNQKYMNHYTEEEKRRIFAAELILKAIKSGDSGLYSQYNKEDLVAALATMETYGIMNKNNVDQDLIKQSLGINNAIKPEMGEHTKAALKRRTEVFTERNGGQEVG
jgi:hypothetical protein